VTVIIENFGIIGFDSIDQKELTMKRQMQMRSLLYTIRQFGFDPLRFYNAVRQIPIYIGNLLQFLNIPSARGTLVRGKFRLVPSLHDRYESAGQATGHYFWQDLIVARQIFNNAPKKHLDVGSRIDGFIAHLLTFREVDVLDVRPLQSSITGLEFVVGDATKELVRFEDKYDSVSCLHSLEHFGLGRYGDKIEVDGHLKGLVNISKCVSAGGSFYLSVPLGANTIEFNTQRLLLPRWPIDLLVNFELLSYTEIPWKGLPFSAEKNLEFNLFQPGSAGLYHFLRKN